MKKQINLNTKLISSLSNILFVHTADLFIATGINRSTWYRIRNAPVNISIQQLLAISNGLHIPVRRFFSTDKSNVIGKRDDYINEPYLFCYYDDAALQRIVNTHSDATWKKAADATGVTRDNLRKSLLAYEDRHTPVVRFLAACNALDIDPFTILIDPNPERKGKKNKRSSSIPPIGSNSPVPPNSEVAIIKAEVETLRRQVKELTNKVVELEAQKE